VIGDGELASLDFVLFEGRCVEGRCVEGLCVLLEGFSVFRGFSRGEVCKGSLLGLASYRLG